MNSRDSGSSSMYSLEPMGSSRANLFVIPDDDREDETERNESGSRLERSLVAAPEEFGVHVYQPGQIMIPEGIVRVIVPNFVVAIEDGACASRMSPEDGLDMGDDDTLREVIFESGSELRSIGRKAFYGCHRLEMIHIPDRVETIGEYAFADCAELEEVEFPPTALKTIGNNAFEGCYELTEILITSAETIGNEAFLSCAYLSKVALPPSGLRTIGKGAFRNCVSLTSMVIPDTVEKVDEEAFADCPQLCLVKLPRSLVDVSYGLFAQCHSLVGVDMSDRVGSIGPYAFDGCVSLKNIQLSGSLKAIGKFAFHGCHALEQVLIPHDAPIGTIGEHAFQECCRLETFRIPSQVTSVGRMCFDGCTELYMLHMPKTNITFGSLAFRGCRKIRAIKVSNPPRLRKRKSSKLIELSNDMPRMGIRSSVATEFTEATLPSKDTRNRFDMGRKVRESILTSTVKVFSKDSREKKNSTVTEGVETRRRHRERKTSTIAESLKFRKKDDDHKEILREYEDLTAEPGSLLQRILNDSGQFHEFIASMFESGNFDFQGLYRRHVDSIVERTTESPRMQQALMDLSVGRRSVFFLMLEGYFNFALLVSFVSASSTFLVTQKRSIRSCVILSITTFVFGMREIVEGGSEPLRYVEDFWNVIDLVRVGLVTTCIVILMREDPGDVSESIAHIFLTTGVLVIVGVILFLRRTFLPYAEFVGGLIAVMTKLVPFLVVSILLTFTFSFMFFTLGYNNDECYDGRNNTECDPDEGECDHGGRNRTKCDPDDEECEHTFCTVRSATLRSFSFIFSGPEQTKTWWLDIAFGFMIVIILLNVVIAIVSSAWESSVEKGKHFFWAYRISFLADVESVQMLKNRKSRKDHGKETTRLARWKVRLAERFDRFDAWGNRSLRDHINWNSHPFRLASEKSEYDECVKYREIVDDNQRKLLVSDYEKLHNIGSFARDWYFASLPPEAKRTKKPTGSQEANIDKTEAEAGESTFVRRARVVLHFVLFIVCCVLGLFPTCGLLWPKRIRSHVFGIDIQQDAGEESRHEEINKLETKIQRLEERLQQMDKGNDKLLREMLQGFKQLEGKMKDDMKSLAEHIKAKDGERKPSARNDSDRFEDPVGEEEAASETSETTSVSSSVLYPWRTR